MVENIDKKMDKHIIHRAGAGDSTKLHSAEARKLGSWEA